MKVRFWFPVVLIGCVLASAAPAVQAQGVFGKLKQKVKQKVEESTDSATSTSTTTPAASASTPAASITGTSDAAASNGAASSNGAAPADAANSTMAYQNYDFVPGNTIVFADDFTNTQDGEFPDQWNLLKGQAVVNKQQGYQTFLLTDGNYAQVSPRMKTKSYVGPDFTIEYDVFAEAGAFPLQIEMDHASDGNSAAVRIGPGGASYDAEGVNLAAALPPAIRDSAYENKWHHIAIVYRKPQIKLYVDQYRVLVVPDSKFDPGSFIMEGIGDQEKPIIFRNVRIADGGGMNIVGKKFTDAKIVTHGINFDIDKAMLRPESMGTLNQIKSIMEADPSLKFEIDGHTDNTGDAAHNLTLSQQRADAVKAQLVSMGVDASRLTTKGLGDTKPMTSNDTPEGKANNRRVEFVRIT